MQIWFAYIKEQQNATATSDLRGLSLRTQYDECYFVADAYRLMSEN